MKHREKQTWRKFHQIELKKESSTVYFEKKSILVQFSSHFSYNFQFELEVAMLQYCLRTYLFCARKARKSKLKLFTGVCHSPLISAIHTRRHPWSQTQNPFHGFQWNIIFFIFVTYFLKFLRLNGMISYLACTMVWSAQKNLAGSIWQRLSLAKKWDYAIPKTVHKDLVTEWLK